MSKARDNQLPGNVQKRFLWKGRGIQSKDTLKCKDSYYRNNAEKCLYCDVKLYNNLSGDLNLLIKQISNILQLKKKYEELIITTLNLHLS